MRSVHIKKSSKIIIITICALVLVSAVAVALLYNMSRIKLSAEKVTLEAGAEFDPYSYIQAYPLFSFSDSTSDYSEKITVQSTVDTSVPGSYAAGYYTKSGRLLTMLPVNVIDTVAPELELKKDYILLPDTELQAEDLISKCTDATEITYTLTSDYDPMVTGAYSASVTATDLGGNETTATVYFTVMSPDETAPVIEGVHNMVCTAGVEADFLEGVTATDNYDLAPVITVDDGGYDSSVPGAYLITYTASDASGNTSNAAAIAIVPGSYSNISESTGSGTINGLSDISITKGNDVDYMNGVTLSEDFDEDTEIMYSAANVDTQITGTYTVLYAALNKNDELVTSVRYVYVKNEPFMYTPTGCSFTFDAAGISNQPYIVLVNRAMCCVTVYAKDENDHYTVPVKAFTCSVGREGHETPTGRYTTGSRFDWCYMVDGSWGRNAIFVIQNQGIMFHSVCYYTKSTDNLEYEEFNKLGTPASLGCIRLSYADVTWIYNNCPSGFTTIIYDDATCAGPLGKPASIIIDVNDEEARKYDPTDTNH